jgi:paraquat-inducible protein A
MSTARSQGLAVCHTCTALNEEDRSNCRRCDSHVHTRIPNSIERKVALLIASIVLYIPANMYPIMITEQQGVATESTIIGGVILLWGMGSYAVALVIFIASVLVPIAKILSLAALCVTVRKKHTKSRKQRTQMYRITEIIGKWSMVDVFVVAILVALIQITGILVISPGGAALAFAAMVIVTMFAAEEFDPRLIWDQDNQLENDDAGS